MPKKRRQAIVIDASVARSAGRTDHDRSRACREFLRWVLKYCHHLVINADIDKEWKNHASAFARAWRVAMVQKGKVNDLGHQDCGTLKNRIEGLQLNKSSLRAMQKDAFLVVAAQAADRVIVSLDNVACNLFEQHATQLKTPRGITWRNPEEEPVPWT